MTIDNLDMNHINDSEHNPVPIVQENTQLQGWIEHTLNDINSRLDWLRLELPKTIEEQENEVLELVKVRGLKKSFENNRFTLWVTVKKIQDWVFSIISNKTWNINYFVNNDWEILFWVFNIKERPFIENWKAFEYAWFKERKEDGVYNMYKLEWDKEVWPIDINSPEYYQAWLDILFYADILNKLLRLKHNVESDNLDIELFIEWGSFRFEDLELFLNKWLITKEIFDFWVKEMQKVIVTQCSDKRLLKLDIPIKESDVVKYYTKWYIDKDIALECYKAMPEDMRNVTGKKKD